MRFACRQSALRGQVPIPGSKSHTIRAVVIAGLADGTSAIEAPLVSGDTRSAIHAMRGLGAEVNVAPDCWQIVGVAGEPRVRYPTIDTGNSGTTILVLMGVASLLRTGQVTLTGDEQIRRRPAGPLAQALNDLGARVVSLPGNGCPPLTVSGRLRGGHTRIEAVTSQYLSSLLLASPLAPALTRIDVPLLNERPYVQMTLDWLDAQGIRIEHDDMRVFRLTGGRSYHAFHRRIPADFSSATFFLGAGALAGNEVTCLGLDLADSQADKAVVRYLRDMGAHITEAPGRLTVQARGLTGTEIDMNETPDALPVMAVIGCFARGTTVLRNVAHARIKETDRITVMRQELAKMGARIEERPDGLVIHESALRGAPVDGHADHRVVMALALAGMSCPGHTTIATAEAAGVTFPAFADLMRSLGGAIATEADDA